MTNGEFFKMIKEKFEFKVNDIVKVLDWGFAFSSDLDWFNDHSKDLKIDWIATYAYLDQDKYYNCKTTDNHRYIILYVDYEGHRALIKDADTDMTHTYLIRLEALTRYHYEKEMTVKEIEKELGYPIKIISDDKLSEAYI